MAMLCVIKYTYTCTSLNSQVSYDMQQSEKKPSWPCIYYIILIDKCVFNCYIATVNITLLGQNKWML